MSWEKPDAWAEDAARLPIAFSQVREDPAVDEAILRRVGAPACVWMIASGGDTAAWLVATGLSKLLHLVDFNAAQLEITRLKLRLLADADETTRLGVLGHETRGNRVAGWLSDPEALGPSDLLEERGPDFVGRYEVLFAHLRAEVPRLGEETAFAEVMRLENLRCLFGEAATRNARVSFAEHFLERVCWARTHLPPTEHAFIDQMLRAGFLDGRRYRWHRAASPSRWPVIEYEHASAKDSLRAASAGSYDMIHLSNILDWLSVEEATEILALAWRALRPGGYVLVRQLNSTLDIPAAGTRYRWHDTKALHRRDQSFFYRALHLGEKA